MCGFPLALKAALELPGSSTSELTLFQVSGQIEGIFSSRVGNFLQPGLVYIQSWAVSGQL